MNKHTKRNICSALSLVFALSGGGLLAFPALGSALMYEPVNPTFGGNPLNTTHLFNRAEAINDYEADDDSSSSSSLLSSLTSTLQSRLISQLLSSGEAGSIETDDYSIIVTDNDGSMTISIIDKSTGESTSIEVSGL
ncbi:curli assembly protein CsgF [Vibrio fluvialis]|nr:curli assembly protein CsgF [Vibrio fluvialis]EPP27231.1 Curli production assembly/transport component CsgF [Vibrio fluvialis I21563]MBL4304224.1 curli production assembly protein CsgF [Vibrio fluvialis]MBY7802055.1 curli assembly protein CsgF [Vibrio fluvialis]MBY7839967.1 curli assembly protein CsgF [Vibrio fluvialis]MBY7862657.1 curli assembly protein CsgF [Vibrio fluvialis]